MKFTLVLLSVAASALAEVAHSHAKRDNHAHVASVHRRNTTEAGHLVKRESYTGTATWYDVTPNAGACGDWMHPYDDVVALNHPMIEAHGGYATGKPADCYRSITIQANGVTSQARIMDECPPCAWGSLDLSEGLFKKFASLDQGVFQLTWWFNDGDNSGGNQPTTTSQWQASTTTTQAYTPPAPTTTSTTSTTPSSTPSPTTTSSGGGNSIQEVPTTTTAVSNLQDVNMAVVRLAAFVNNAAGL